MPHFYPFQKAAEARERARRANQTRLLDTLILLVVLTVLVSGLAALLHDVADEPAPDTTNQQGG